MPGVPPLTLKHKFGTLDTVKDPRDPERSEAAAGSWADHFIFY